jgi:hypothetical protein
MQATLRHHARVDAGFKPLALPALAAAVQMSRRETRKPAGERQVPAILRVEALTD